MHVVGFSLAKNCVMQDYPIDLVIKQHASFFDLHVIGMPSEKRDDGTADLIAQTALDVGQRTKIIRLPWPGSAAWTEESLDRSLQELIIEEIMKTCRPKPTWIVKIDADEFYHEDHIELLLEIMDLLADNDDTHVISTNYRQYMGSPRFHCWDPTKSVRHIFKPNLAKFSGNDAMQIDPSDVKHILHLEDVILHHIGYLKDQELITTRIREHLVLNESMYEDPDPENLANYRFDFPKHVKGAKMWPIGLASILQEEPNELEYMPHPISSVPRAIRDSLDRFTFYEPKV